MTRFSSQNFKSRTQAGFTLVELLIVIVILAILASSIAIFSGKTAMNSRLKACQANLLLLDSANSTYEIDKNLGLSLDIPWNIPTLLKGGYLDLDSNEYSSSLGILGPNSICPLLVDSGSIFLVNDSNFMIEVDSVDFFRDENSLSLKKSTSIQVVEPTTLNRGQNTIQGSGLTQVDCVAIMSASNWLESKVFPSGSAACPDGAASNNDSSSVTFNDNTSRSNVYILIYFSDGSRWRSKRTFNS